MLGVVFNCVYMYFNSIKVQLEHAMASLNYAQEKFQFHKGTIRTIFLLMLPMLCCYFNSIKVQLEHQVHR